MDSFNYIEDVEGIVPELRQEGFIFEADLLSSDIKNSSTGTEACMALRFHCSQILREKKISTPLQEKIVNFIANLNKLLK